MIKRHLYYAVLAGTAVFTLSASQLHAAQDGFLCPTQTLEGNRADEIHQVLPTKDAFLDPNDLSKAVAALQSENQSPAMIVDQLMAAYCPFVADNTSATETEKTQDIRQFATRVTQLVYGAGDTDENAIIFDVPFPPDVASSINQNASDAGISPEAWIRGVVEAAID